MTMLDESNLRIYRRWPPVCDGVGGAPGLVVLSDEPDKETR